MNKFVKALINMSEASMQNNGYVRNLLRTYGGKVSNRANTPKD